jgi:hypothetical protein
MDACRGFVEVLFVCDGGDGLEPGRLGGSVYHENAEGNGRWRVCKRQRAARASGHAFSSVSWKGEFALRVRGAGMLTCARWNKTRVDGGRHAVCSPGDVSEGVEKGGRGLGSLIAGYMGFRGRWGAGAQHGGFAEVLAVATVCQCGVDVRMWVQVSVRFGECGSLEIAPPLHHHLHHHRGGGRGGEGCGQEVRSAGRVLVGGVLSRAGPEDGRVVAGRPGRARGLRDPFFFFIFPFVQIVGVGDLCVSGQGRAVGPEEMGML